jgi:hypothetical protein
LFRGSEFFVLLFSKQTAQMRGARVRRALYSAQAPKQRSSWAVYFEKSAGGGI